MNNECCFVMIYIYIYIYIYINLDLLEYWFHIKFWIYWSILKSFDKISLIVYWISNILEHFVERLVIYDILVNFFLFQLDFRHKKVRGTQPWWFTRAYKTIFEKFINLIFFNNILVFFLFIWIGLSFVGIFFSLKPFS